MNQQEQQSPKELKSTSWTAVDKRTLVHAGVLFKQTEFRKVKVRTFSREILLKFSAVPSNRVDMTSKNNAHITVLEDLRDTLLPKLLSRELKLAKTILVE